jgi:hypothetical protein
MFAKRQAPVHTEIGQCQRKEDHSQKNIEVTFLYRNSTEITENARLDWFFNMLRYSDKSLHIFYHLNSCALICVSLTRLIHRKKSVEHQGTLLSLLTSPDVRLVLCSPSVAIGDRTQSLVQWSAHREFPTERQ